jgi:hypothetical protein
LYLIITIPEPPDPPVPESPTTFSTATSTTCICCARCARCNKHLDSIVHHLDLLHQVLLDLIQEYNYGLLDLVAPPPPDQNILLKKLPPEDSQYAGLINAATPWSTNTITYQVYYPGAPPFPDVHPDPLCTYCTCTTSSTCSTVTSVHLYLHYFLEGDLQEEYCQYLQDLFLVILSIDAPPPDPPGVLHCLEMVQPPLVLRHHLLLM